MKKNTMLTRKWNNVISLALGLPLTFFVGNVLINSEVDEFTNFLGLVIFGVVY